MKRILPLELPPDLPYGSVELGKNGEYWTVTYWIPEIVLRLTIHHDGDEFEEDEYICKVKPSDAHDFCTLCRFRVLTMYLDDDLDRSLFAPDTLEVFPETHRSAFLAMARHWARVMQITPLTPSPVVWRNGEPVFVSDSHAESSDNGQAVDHGSGDKPPVPNN
jgi:hypothetical protein